jgi:hypothetical protein
MTYFLLFEEMFAPHISVQDGLQSRCIITCNLQIKSEQDLHYKFAELTSCST